MSPVLLDALTIFFIVAGLALLWLNLRVWRRRTVPKEQATARLACSEDKPASSATSVLEGAAGDFLQVSEISEAEIARSRARAEECLEQAERSMSEADKAVWLRMADKWIKLIEDVEQRRSGK